MTLLTLRSEVARVFKPLLAPSRYKGIHGGRGSGKSHFFAERAVLRCVANAGTRIVCVREVQKTLKESVKLLLEDKIRTLAVSEHFQVRDKEIRTPQGGLILFQGMADHTAESIKSLEGFDVAYVEEAQTMTARSLEMLRPTIRKMGSELWFSWNPRHASDPVDSFLRGQVLPPGATVVKADYLDNPFFPGVLEEERLFDEAHSPTRYGHVWLGEYEPAATGAIWDRLTIHQGRVAECPPLKRILVSIDPAGSSEKGANETGIVAVGIGEDGRGYVLEDASLVGKPDEWARQAIAVYDMLSADAIVAEVNYGGDMVVNTIRAIRPTLKVIEVRATRGKHVRAEPIAALYALGKISHVGAYPELENQQCLMTASGFEGEGSPDRVDALVWGFTELFPRLTPKSGLTNRPLPSSATNQYQPHRWRA